MNIFRINLWCFKLGHLLKIVVAATVVLEESEHALYRDNHVTISRARTTRSSRGRKIAGRQIHLIYTVYWREILEFIALSFLNTHIKITLKILKYFYSSRESYCKCRPFNIIRTLHFSTVCEVWISKANRK